MDTKIIKIDKESIDLQKIKDCADSLKKGGLVAFPTETVYGLGANALDEEAVKKIYVAKGRPSDNPLILHISGIEQVKALVKEIPALAREVMEKFWPGPVTIILEKSKIVPDIITGGLDTVAIRMPNHPIALELISQAGVAIAAPSANTSGRPSPTNASHVIEDMMGKVDIIIDGGNTRVGLESTVLDLSTSNPSILRPGAVTLEDLKRIIPELSQDQSIIDEETKPKSPGQKYRHYAPKADMILFTGDRNRVIEEINLQIQKWTSLDKKLGIMSTEESKDSYDGGLVLVVGSRAKPETIAANLFSTIRSFDKEEVDIILAEGIGLDNIGMAIMNRMIKAAGGKIIKL